MGIKRVLSRIFSGRPVRPVAPEARPRTITPPPMVVSTDGVQAAKPLPADPFPKPFLIDASRLGKILDQVRQGREIDRKYVFDLKKGLLAMDGEEDRYHWRIANAVWPEGYRRTDITGGRLKFEYAEGVFKLKISEFSTSFRRKYEDLMNDRRLIREHLQGLLANRNYAFAHSEGDLEDGLVLTIKTPGL